MYLTRYNRKEVANSQFNRNPRFALNPQVARSLDLSVPRAQPDEAALARLAELAKGPGPSIMS